MFAKKRSVKNSTQEEQAGTDPEVHSNSKIRQRKRYPGCVYLCSMCTTVPEKRRGGKEGPDWEGSCTSLEGAGRDSHMW